jgi:hypothetical protein
VNVKNSSFGLLIWQWELNFSINSSWSNKGRIQGINSVGCHDNLDVSSENELKNKEIRKLIISYVNQFKSDVQIRKVAAKKYFHQSQNKSGVSCVVIGENLWAAIF